MEMCIEDTINSQTHTHTSRHETPSSTYRQTYIAQLGSARFVCLENRGIFIVLVCATAATTHQSIFIYSLYGLNAVSHSQSQRMFTRMNQFQHTHLICNRKRSKSQMMRSRHILDLVARLKIYRMCLSVWQGMTGPIKNATPNWSGHTIDDGNGT